MNRASLVGLEDDIKRARSFWQQRAANAASAMSSALENATASVNSTTTTSKPVTVNVAAPPVPSTVPPATPPTKSTQAVDSAPNSNASSTASHNLSITGHAPVTPMTPAPDLPGGPAAPGAAEAAFQSATATASVALNTTSVALNNMFKTLSEKTTSVASSASASKSTALPPTNKDAASQPSLASIPVQLPDMTVWKERVRSYSSAQKAKSASASFTSAISSSWKNISGQGTATPDKENSSPTAASVRAMAMANNVHCPYEQDGGSPPPLLMCTSAYGELLVVEVLACRDLAVGDLFQGESDPYCVVKFREKERRSAVAKSTLNPVYNERFVFWEPKDRSVENDRVTLQIMNENMVMADEHLGEVHLSLAVPVNQPFDAWYPLVKEDGTQRGRVRVGVRRLLITSPPLQLAAKSMSANERSLNDEDLANYGRAMPDLWYGFAEAEEPFEEVIKPAKQTEVIANKLNDFGRRFMGIEFTSSSEPTHAPLPPALF
ncbi:TPA: hypothetical protein N0F65_001411 [Lagenidium giganteum]|uniref:C2 domain-containing protein n=1 Tax=Lagenidium giganteum TaxID=4803 RepID=A0AAV2Z1X2_9STRA|nr:TPA: hypothetical protein N0F65_001411 [Lagenidium giganteum]